MTESANVASFNFLIVGHLDHSKSTYKTSLASIAHDQYQANVRLSLFLSPSFGLDKKQQATPIFPDASNHY
ncbi:hypothetical protein ACLOJK_028338 [Asimina triloba]